MTLFPGFSAGVRFSFPKVNLILRPWILVTAWL